MGNIRHETLIISADQSLFEKMREDINAFRGALSDRWNRLLIGPIDGVTNSLQTIVFLPEGSKLGWREQMAGHQMRDMFADMFDDTHADIVRVTHGGDDYDEVLIKVPDFEEKTVRLRRHPMTQETSSTGYTADDFAQARFAYVGERSVARRVEPCPTEDADHVSSSFDPATPWRARDTWLSDEHMAAAGWIPVIEQTPTD